ncbi:YceD family protein [Thiohalomonas denitrificans]|uniref:YceD family protein n=1 Tax=Thiohalomonas denitrificans TaxID=415747 RepID=UPI0026EBE0E2|nr:YceD family protein [Thiohalomonas denitrificans]
MIRALMNERLPDRTEPFRLAQRGAVFTGKLPLAGMDRLASSLVNSEGSVDVTLRFGTDERHQAVVEVKLQTELTLTCQNCLESYLQPVAIETTLGIIRTESEAERIPRAYEPLVVGDEPLSIKRLVEDELILALPIIPRHFEDCLSWAATEEVPEPDSEAADRNERENPFEVLRRLKKER